MTPVPRPETRRVYETDAAFVSVSHAESAHLIDAGFAGELVSESPFQMRFPAAARAVAEQRRRRRSRYNAERKRFLPKHVQDRM